MRMSRQVRQRMPKYVVTQLIFAEGADSEPVPEEERHDSWTDSSHERAHAVPFQEEFYYEPRLPTVSRHKIGFSL